MTQAVGRDRLVIDISCRRGSDGHYYVATNRWQTVTADPPVDAALIRQLEPFCAEFLVHAADVEGKCEGIDEELVASWRMGLFADHLCRRGQAAGRHCPR